jgi:hypothetical protein
MANFIYTNVDLQRQFVDVIGCPGLNFESFGFDSDTFLRVENLDFDAFKLTIQINDDTVKSYGFLGMEEFMDYYCRSHIWNNYKFSINDDELSDEIENKTLHAFLYFYYDKASRLFPNENIPVPPNNGNILDYLKSYKSEWLLSIGW